MAGSTREAAGTSFFVEGVRKRPLLNNYVASGQARQREPGGKTKKLRTAAAGAAATVAVLGVSVVGAGPASAAVGDGTCDNGEFCAFRLANYVDILLESKAKNQKVDVVDDKTTSIKNRTSWKWVAVDSRTGPLPDRKKDLAAHTSWSQLDSGWDNKINHFDAKS